MPHRRPLSYLLTCADYPNPVFSQLKQAANPKVLQSIKEADIIIGGPGDLYTTVLPVLIVPFVKEALNKSRASKIFVVNVTNKPFETKGYKVKDYIEAIRRHLGNFPFEKVIVNNNLRPLIPSRFNYKYVDFDSENYDNIAIIKADLIAEKFPLYHDSEKLAKTIAENI